MSYYYHYFGAMSPAMATYKAWQHRALPFRRRHLPAQYDCVCRAAAALNIGKFHELLRQKELDAARLGENLAELQLQTLRMQINPHFLFNSLNAVCVLVKKGERESAIEMIRKMGSFMRRTLDDSADQWVRARQGARNGRGLSGHCAISASASACASVKPAMPRRWASRSSSMLLQPLVENAVVHGIAEHAADCELEVSCLLREGKLLIRVSDNGAGSLSYGDARFKEGIGLRNVRQRLEQFYQGQHSFVFDSQPGAGARVTIEIPADSALAAPGASSREIARSGRRR